MRALGARGALTRLHLTPGTCCTHAGAACQITSTIQRPLGNGDAFFYEIKDSKGKLQRVSEVDLELLSFAFPEEPLEMLVQWFPEKFSMFKARDGFMHNFTRLVHQAG